MRGRDRGIDSGQQFVPDLGHHVTIDRHPVRLVGLHGAPVHQHPGHTGVGDQGCHRGVGADRLAAPAVARQLVAQRFPLAEARRAQVLLEAPHRIEALAQALAVLGERRVTLGRELTKQFEQIETLPARALPQWLAERPEHQRGEFVLVVHDQAVATTQGEGERVLQCLLAELPVKTAVKLAAEISGEPRNALYERALALKKDL